MVLCDGGGKVYYVLQNDFGILKLNIKSRIKILMCAPRLNTVVKRDNKSIRGCSLS